jgi:ribosomal protein S18 acetylase RimI-like enzyme
MELQIRRWQPADHDVVWELNNHSLNIVGAHPGDAMFADLHDVGGVYFDNGGEFYVGCVDGAVVAMGAFKRTHPDSVELTRMRIHPDFQRHGFGQQILSALEARAREMGYASMHLETTVQQVAAQRLYERNGFVQTGTGTYDDFKLLIYEKPLS